MKSIVSIFVSLAVASFGQICLAAEAPKPVDNGLKQEVASPERILPDGVDSNISTNPYTGESGTARKGTVAATLNNVALLNKILLEAPTAENRVVLQKAIDINSGLIPSLRVIGMFDLFSVEEWVDIDDQPGRVLTGVLYIQRYPQDITPDLRAKLEQIQKQTKIKLIADAIAKALRS